MEKIKKWICTSCHTSGDGIKVKPYHLPGCPYVVEEKQDRIEKKLDKIIRDKCYHKCQKIQWGVIGTGILMYVILVVIGLVFALI